MKYIIYNFTIKQKNSQMEIAAHIGFIDHTLSEQWFFKVVPCTTEYYFSKSDHLYDIKYENNLWIAVYVIIVQSIQSFWTHVLTYM